MSWPLDLGMKAHPKARTLLDVGAGVGLLVGEARKGGLDAVGSEPSRQLAGDARRLNDAEVVAGTLPHPALASRKFDLVYMVDVVEYLADPVNLLRCCADMLAPDGLRVVVTPDVSSLAARMFGKRRWHFRLAHEGFFDRKSLRVAHRPAELQVIRWLRAKWFFPARYLAQRVAVYLPVAWFNALTERLSPLRWVYNRTVPLNLHDSLVAFSGRTA